MGYHPRSTRSIDDILEIAIKQSEPANELGLWHTLMFLDRDRVMFALKLRREWRRKNSLSEPNDWKRRREVFRKVSQEMQTLLDDLQAEESKWPMLFGNSNFRPPSDEVNYPEVFTRLPPIIKAIKRQADTARTKTDRITDRWPEKITFGQVRAVVWSRYYRRLEAETLTNADIVRLIESIGADKNGWNGWPPACLTLIHRSRRYIREQLSKTMNFARTTLNKSHENFLEHFGPYRVKDQRTGNVRDAKTADNLCWITEHRNGHSGRFLNTEDIWNTYFYTLPALRGYQEWLRSDRSRRDSLQDEDVKTMPCYVMDKCLEDYEQGRWGDKAQMRACREPFEKYLVQITGG